MQIVDLGEFGQFSPGRATTLRRVFGGSGFVGAARFEGTTYRFVSMGKRAKSEGFMITAHDDPPPKWGEFEAVIDSVDFVTGSDVGAVRIYDRVISIEGDVAAWMDRYRSMFRRTRPIFPGTIGSVPHSMPPGPGPFSPQRQLLDAFGPYAPYGLYSAAAVVPHPKGVREVVAVCQAFTVEHARAQLVGAMGEGSESEPLWGVHIDETRMRNVNTWRACYLRPFRGESVEEWTKLLGLESRVAE